ncbi:MAG: type II secretion system protein PulP [Desulfuromonadaceae bacterium]|nr:type II secretion system protein PulP [Desulfuromonadaceae bacterium]
MNRQRLILLVLVILFAIAVFWSYRAVPRPRTVSSLTFKPGHQSKPAAAAADKQARTADDGRRVKISLLDQEPTGFKGYRRNLFKPVFVDEVKTVKQRPIEIKPSPQVPMPPVVPAIIQPEVAPLARFTFLGYLKKGAVKTIFLAKDNDILLVKKGDKFADRYEATDISDQALTLTVTDTGAVIIIPLIENRALAMPR